MSQRQACTHRLRTTTTSASMGCQRQQACMLLSRLHSTAGVASILSSPALLTVLPFDANALRSYTALVPLRWLRQAFRLGCSKRWLRGPSTNSGSDVF